MEALDGVHGRLVELPKRHFACTFHCLRAERLQDKLHTGVFFAEFERFVTPLRPTTTLLALVSAANSILTVSNMTHCASRLRC